jgi:hypothetical protein
MEGAVDAPTVPSDEHTPLSTPCGLEEVVEVFLCVLSCHFSTYKGWFRNAPNLRAWIYEYLPSRVQVLDASNFDKSVLSHKEPWIVYFYAPWCGHCQQFAPNLERVAHVSVLCSKRARRHYGLAGFLMQCPRLAITKKYVTEKVQIWHIWLTLEVWYVAIEKLVTTSKSKMAATFVKTTRAQ